MGEQWYARCQNAARIDMEIGLCYEYKCDVCSLINNPDTPY